MGDFGANRMRLEASSQRLFLPLRLAADHLLDLFLERAAGGGALGLGGSFLARRALELLAFGLVFDLCGVGHVNLFPSNVF